MNRDRMLLGLGGALIVAFLASVYVYRQLSRVRPTLTVKGPAQVQVVVAVGPLKVGQRLTAKDLAVLDWPEGKQPPDSFSRPEDCVGHALTSPLVENEPVLKQELAPVAAGEGLPVTIPQGMRAVSVGVDDVVAVAGFVTPGTIVDILVTGMGANGSVTRTILEHIRVIAVGQQLQTESGKPQTAPVVTFLVTPEDAEKLTLAAADGKIHLALRNTVDTADANPSPVYGSTIFTGTVHPVATPRVVVAKPAPARAPEPPPWPVQVIRGDKTETQSFPR